MSRSFLTAIVGVLGLAWCSLDRGSTVCAQVLPIANANSTMRGSMPQTFGYSPLPVFSPSPIVNMVMAPQYYGMPPIMMPGMGYGTAAPGGSGYGYRTLERQNHSVSNPDYGTSPAGTEPRETPESRFLSAAGVLHDDGKLRWPLGLRILPGDEVAELREQLDSLFRLAATQAEAGRINRNVIEEIGRNVAELRRRLLEDKRTKFAMARATYDDAENYLAKLQRAQRLMKAGLETDRDRRLRTNTPANDLPPPASADFGSK